MDSVHGRDRIMNPLRVVFCLCSVLSFAQTQNYTHPMDSTGGVTHVHTALGHVSLLEFKEPVTAAAAGSKNFHIERFNNKVLITPSKAGVSTNLFVWTASQRFSYELDAPEETTSMTLAIDAPAPEHQPSIDIEQQQTRLLTQMLLVNGMSGLRHIDSTSIKSGKDAVLVRVEGVFQTRDTLYIYFTIDNQSKQPFRMSQPAIYRLESTHSAVSSWSFVNRQIDSNLSARLNFTKFVSVPISYAEFQPGDIVAGARKAGVIAVQLAAVSPTVLTLVFTDTLRATFGM
jgi:hypothetical protein